MSDPIRKADTQLKYKAGRNLAEFRQWYYQQSPPDRLAFKEKMQALAEASKSFDGIRVPITVRLHLDQRWYSDDDCISIKGDGTPSEVLAAIVEWDRVDEDEKTWSLD
jgi:hypothetical protein